MTHLIYHKLQSVLLTIFELTPYYYLYTMPPPKGALWDYFHVGEKQNASHYRAHCRGCLENHRPFDAAIELDDDGNTNLGTNDWMIQGMYAPNTDVTPDPFFW